MFMRFFGASKVLNVCKYQKYQNFSDQVPSLDQE